MAKQKTKTQFVLNAQPEPKLKPRGNPDAIRPFQFKPGQSANPGGRPKGSGAKKISIAYEAALGQKLPDEVKDALHLDGDNITWADAIALQLVRKTVMSGVTVCFESITELREVTEGKIPEKSEIAGAGGAPLQAPTFSVNLVDPKKE